MPPSRGGLTSEAQLIDRLTPEDGVVVSLVSGVFSVPTESLMMYDRFVQSWLRKQMRGFGVNINNIYLLRLRSYFGYLWPDHGKMTSMTPSAWLLLGISELSVNTSTIEAILIVG
jgi:hypothetical protein